VGAAVLGVAVKPTIKEVDGDGNVVKTLQRSRLVEVQTPQARAPDILPRRARRRMVPKRRRWLRSVHRQGTASVMMTAAGVLRHRVEQPFIIHNPGCSANRTARAHLSRAAGDEAGWMQLLR